MSMAADQNKTNGTRQRDGSSRAGFEKREKRRNIRHLQNAIVEGDVKVVQEILNSDFDVDFQYDSKTSLQLAVCQGSAEICSLLISKGANVNQADADGNSLLNMACWRGFKDVVELLVKNGADLDSQNESGNTPLNVCAHKGSLQIAKILLSANCSRDLANKSGNSPLYCVSLNGDAVMAHLLLEAGADPNWVDLSYNSPLMAAAREGHEKVVAVLLEGGADVNKQNRQGRTAICEAAAKGFTEVLQHLIKYNADPNLSTIKGITPLLEAIANNQTKAADMLVEGGADVNQADRMYLAPIHAVIRQVSNMFDPSESVHMRKLLEKLMDAGADVNKYDGENWTPLCQAASAGDLELCRFLLNKKAAIDRVTRHGSSMLHAAVYGGNMEVVKLFLDAGARVNSVDDQGQHALLAAVSSRCDIKIITLLLDAGSDVNIAHSKSRQTALHEAIYQHYATAAHLLIDRGSSLTALNTEKKSPLYLACQRGLSETVIYMLSKGCSTSSPHIQALPIHAAASQSRAGTIRILSDYGCNLNEMNEKGETPITVACAEDNFSAVRALLQCGCDLEFQRKKKGLQLCCIYQEDPHPHLALEPLFLAMTHKNMDMIKMLLQCYRYIPCKVIRLLQMLLKRTVELSTHYSPQQKKEITDIFGTNLRTPFTLADASRRCVRSFLTSPIQEQVKHLPVGEKVKKYILMESEFEEWQELEQQMLGGSTGFSDIFIRKEPI